MRKKSLIHSFPDAITEFSKNERHLIAPDFRHPFSANIQRLRPPLMKLFLFHESLHWRQPLKNLGLHHTSKQRFSKIDTKCLKRLLWSLVIFMTIISTAALTVDCKPPFAKSQHVSVWVSDRRRRRRSLRRWVIASVGKRENSFVLVTTCEMHDHFGLVLVETCSPQRIFMRAELTVTVEGYRNTPAMWPLSANFWRLSKGLSTPATSR
jgi:hypothetical protein